MGEVDGVGFGGVGLGVFVAVDADGSVASDGDDLIVSCLHEVEHVKDFIRKGEGAGAVGLDAKALPEEAIDAVAAKVPL